jgi:hypothetical protein
VHHETASYKLTKNFQKIALSSLKIVVLIANVNLPVNVSLALVDSYSNLSKHYLWVARTIRVLTAKVSFVPLPEHGLRQYFSGWTQLAGCDQYFIFQYH